MSDRGLQARTFEDDYAMTKMMSTGGQALPPTNPEVDLSPDRLLRLPQVLALFPVSRSTWYEGVRCGTYPKSIPISNRLVAWYLSDILRLLQRHSPEAGDKPKKDDVPPS